MVHKLDKVCYYFCNKLPANFLQLEILIKALGSYWLLFLKPVAFKFVEVLRQQLT